MFGTYTLALDAAKFTPVCEFQYPRSVPKSEQKIFAEGAESFAGSYCEICEGVGMR